MSARILVVDDEADLELLITQKFRKEIRKKELAFEFAGNGHEALDCLARVPDINMVLTDINMPEMDGLTLLGKLHEVKPTLRAIVISAYGDMENIRSAMNRGAYDFLTKPIDFEDLKITLSKTIEHVQELEAFELAREEKRQAQEKALAEEKKAKQAQQKLIEHLKKMDRLKDDFLANTSHELRTPLNGIIGIVDSLIDGVTGPLSEETIRNLSLVVSSGRRLSHLIDDILDFSKMKSDNLPLLSKNVNLQQLCDAVLTLSQPLLAGKDVTLKNEIPETLPAAHADPNRLQQILFNLVGNAIKFTESGSVTINAEVQGEMINISVQDTGVGIPQEQFEDIFKMFRQVENSATRTQGGAGLGLAITRKLVELHKGEITVASTLGEGSCFSFTIPVSTSPDEEDIVALTDSDRLNSAVAGRADVNLAEFSTPILHESEHTILVVDDEPVNQQVLANHLSLQSYSVVHAMSGPEALKLIEETPNRFDLVVLDIMMPGMSGYEVCKAIRQRFALFELPILMLTAKREVKDFVLGFELGANDYIAKPFDKRELLSRIHTLIALKDAVGAAVLNQARLREEHQRAEDLRNEKHLLARKAEASAKAEAHAVEVSRQKTDFLAVMSHELRTPLNAIIGYSEILHEELQEEDQPVFIPDVLKIQNAGKNLLSMINNLLDLTKIEAGKMDLYLEDFRLQTLFEEVATTIEPLARKNGNVVKIEVDPAIEIIRADTTKLRQVLLNLTGNACKFSRQGSVSLIAEPDEDIESIRILVRDTGIGMSADQLGRIFKPFGQAEKSTSRYYGGTGLGLVITQRFCQMMGGSIGVESELGKGTTFWVRLQRQCQETTTV